MVKKDLHTLIRLRKWDVDEKQRTLGQLLRQEESVIERQRDLEAEIAAEITFTSGLPADQRGTLSAYLKRCDEFREKLRALLTEVHRQIAAAQNELAESYRRLKTFEVTQEARDAAETAEENRLEQIELNDIGLELYRRKTMPAH
jgi:flagellar export protein FliJ